MRIHAHIESLNVAIFESLSAFNGRRMNGRSLSRREQIEAEYLRPLPAIRHQMKERRSATVMPVSYTHLDVYKRQVLSLHQLVQLMEKC